MSAQFLVTIPAGITSGQLMQAQSPDGQMVQFQVPDGYEAGMDVPVAYNPIRASSAAVPLAAAVAPTGAPGQQVMFSGTSDPWELINGLQALRIKEKVQLAEILVGFEMPNKYMLQDPVSGKDLFIAAEKGEGVLGIVGRQLFDGDMRPFNMEIALLTEQGVPPQPFVQLERPFKCTCCCFQRPEVFIKQAATGEPIGSVIDPFACCMMTFDIKDKDGMPVLEINHNPCSCALMCWGCPCGCTEVDFEVRDKTGGNTVGHIKKQFRMADAVQALTGLGDADNYTIEFGEVQHPEWKVMILSTALFLDYRFFNKGGQETRESSLLGQVLNADD